MNNASLPPGAGASGLPEPVVFAPGHTPVPASLAAEGAAGEPFLLLIDLADDAGWAGDAAIALAAEWARAGRRVVLADLHLEEPVLHARVGEQNLDGVVDIFLYGASVARSARPPTGHEFFLIPAGTYTATPEDVYAHPRWSKLIPGFHEAGATLMVFVPPTPDGVRRLAEWGRRAVLLGAPAPRSGLPLDELDVRAVLVAPDADGVPDRAEPVPAPPPPPAPRDAADEDLSAEDSPEAAPARSFVDPVADPGPLPPAPAEPLDSGEPVPPAEPLDAAGSLDAVDRDERADERTTEPLAAAGEPDDGDGVIEPEWTLEHEAPTAIPAATPVAEEPDYATVETGDDATFESAPIEYVPRAPQEPRAGTAAPVIPVGRRRRHAGPGPMLWLLVGVAVLAAAVVAAALVRPDVFGRVGLTGGAGSDTLSLVEAIPPPPPAPSPVGDTLPFAVQVRAFVSLQPAQNQARDQARRLPEVPFYVVPEQTQDVLYYKVLAGLVADTAAATELRQRLVGAGVVRAQDARDDAPGAWSLIQARPLAFHLGEYPEAGEAAAQVDSLAQREIPAYAVPFPYSDGTARYRVYAGAYADSALAEDLRQMLRAADLPARLVHRIGQGPTAAQ